MAVLREKHLSYSESVKALSVFCDVECKISMTPGSTSSSVFIP